MISLQEYIFENIINIFESGGFNTFFNTKEECIEFYKNNKHIFSKYNIDDNIITKLYDICGDIPFTIDVDNKQLKLRRLFKDNIEFKTQISKLGEFKRGEGSFKFKDASSEIKIGDGGLSKRAKSGVNTEQQELILCDVINSLGKLNIDDQLKKYKLDNSFKLSVEEQYKKFKSFIENNNEYYAFRPSNDNSELNKNINKLYSDKKLFHGAKNSYITPADIYVVEKSKISEVNDKIVELLDKCKGSGVNYDELFDECKATFYSLLTDKIFIPISLKKITSSNTSNKVEILNVNPYNVNLNKDKYKVYLTKSGLTCIFYTDENENLKLNFRSNQGSIYPCTFEFNKKGDGGAVGKFKTFVIDYIENHDIDIEIPTKDQYFDEYKNKGIKEYNNVLKEIKIKNFEDPKYSEDELKEIESDDKFYYIFIQCVQFLKILNNLYKEGIDNFFTFIESCYLASKKITKYSLPYILIK